MRGLHKHRRLQLNGQLCHIKALALPKGHIVFFNKHVKECKFLKTQSSSFRKDRRERHQSQEKNICTLQDTSKYLYSSPWSSSDATKKKTLKSESSPLWVNVVPLRMSHHHMGHTLDTLGFRLSQTSSQRFGANHTENANDPERYCLKRNTSAGMF